jgi:hypothetical protein
MLVVAATVALIGATAPQALATVGNGSFILFERVGPDGFTVDMYTMDVNGDNEQFFLEKASDGDFSPNGTYVAFDRFTGSGPDIFVSAPMARTFSS